MTIQFDSKEAFEQAMFSYLQDNLSFSVSSSADMVEGDEGRYQSKTTHNVSVELGGKCITSFDLD